MPPHHPIFGHLLVVNNILSELPRAAHAHYLPSRIHRRYPDLGPIYYLDMYPFAPPFLVCVSPTVISQFTTQSGNELPNHPGVKKYLLPITGGRDLASMEGEEWKRWRKIYNPGFGAGHIMNLVPAIVEEVSVFVDILREHARKGDLFSLDEAAINLTMDVIGRVAFSNHQHKNRDHKLSSQTTPNPLTSALRRQVRWCSFGAEPNPFDYMNPLKPLVHWYNSRIMNKYMSRVLESRYPSSSTPPPTKPPSTTTNPSTKKSKAVIDLAHAEYLSSLPSPKNPPSPTTSNPSPRTIEPFSKATQGHMLLFLLGGHDTTATTLTYALHALSSHPHALSRLRAEHTLVFGPSPSPSPTPPHHSLNNLPYTTATIKETLRLYPVVSAPRLGRTHHHLHHNSQPFPTESMLVWSCHHFLHRSPAHWPRADEFLPERWLVGPQHELFPTHGACWRPFEYGPRACIGRELAMTELKVALVMVARFFDVQEGYAEVDRVKEKGWWGGRRERKEVDGERAYQIQVGSARASDGFPCRVREVGADVKQGRVE
ncbi:MAG: hypothetical protein LQ338_001341 [Usnochroma carphineum]|nr:MAG: hypothetical protein LQ338_001341 [Usnochroma carphineum]